MNKMTKADRMFQNAGYKKVKEDNEECVYEYECLEDVDFKKIRFYKPTPSVDLYGQKIYTTMYPEDLEAMIAKAKELNWKCNF